MAQLIEVEGELIEFPDNMSEDDIRVALEQKETPEPPSGFVRGLVDPFIGSAQLIGKGLSALGVDYGKDITDYYSNVEKDYQKERALSGEEGFDWGRLGGNILNPLNIAIGGSSAAINAPRYAQAIVAGAGAGAVSPTSSDDFAKEKATQVATGAVLGPVGEKVASGVGRVMSPLISKSEQTMRDLGVQLTPGESLGGRFKTMEEFAQNLPLIGSSIQNARQKSLYDFNKGIINKPLAKLDGIDPSVSTKLPDDVIGRDAVDFTAEQIDKAYTTVLSNPSFGLAVNAPVKNNIRGAAYSTRLSPNLRQELDGELNTWIFSRLPNNAKADGQSYKGIESDLRKRAFSLMNSQTDMDRSKGEALYEAYKAMRKEVYQQNPQSAKTLRKVDSAYSELSIIDTASANLNSKNGVFTPNAYQSAVKQNDKTRGKKLFSRGRATGSREADSAIEILGDESNDVIQGRLALQIGNLTGVVAGLSDPVSAGTVAATLYGAYSPLGRKAIDTIIAKRPDFLKNLGEIIKNKTVHGGAVTSQEILEAYNKSEEVQPMEIEIVGGN